MNEIEEAFVTTFISRNRRERWLSFLPVAKKREKLLQKLAHSLEGEAKAIDPDGANEEWLQKAAALPRFKKPAWETLGAEDRERLTEACREGNELLEKEEARGS